MFMFMAVTILVVLFFWWHFIAVERSREKQRRATERSMVKVINGETLQYGNRVLDELASINCALNAFREEFNSFKKMVIDSSLSFARKLDQIDGKIETISFDNTVQDLDDVWDLNCDIPLKVATAKLEQLAAQRKLILALKDNKIKNARKKKQSRKTK